MLRQQEETLEMMSMFMALNLGMGLWCILISKH